MPLRVALVGFMGSGKSTVGPLVARRLQIAFLDLDRLVEERSGRTIPQLFADGEAAFRAAEAQALVSLVNDRQLVLSTGGGAPMSAANREVLAREFHTFHLEVSFQESLRRAGPAGNRPLLRRPQAEVRELYDARLPTYRSLGVTLNAEGRTPAVLAREICEWLAARNLTAVGGGP